jgi:hypothetical protein
MKLRIRGNSVRVRLSRSEVDQFCKDGYLEETTEFGTGSLIYALKRKDGITDLSADMSDSKITMFVPTDITKVWAGNEIVGYDNNVDLGGGKQLYLLLEKDFKCIDAPPNEDQSDNFENPHKVC